MSDADSDPPSPPGRAGFLDFVEQWNASQGMATPEIHVRMARWLEEGWTGRLRRRLLLAFRGSGKSTLVGLFCGWLLAREPDLRILVLAAEEALAKKMVRAARRLVERHPFAAGLKPKAADQWAAEQFTVARRLELRDPSMLARGIAANITGTRAEVVICDDVEVPNTVSSPALRETLHERLSEIEYILVPGGLVLYAGTPHAYRSIYAEAGPDRPEERPFLDGYVRLALPAIGPDGCAWPERFPPERIEEVRRASGPLKFASQMLLRPTPDSEVRLDPERLRRYDDELDYTEANRQASLRLGELELVHGIGCWDPSFGRPTGDGSVIAAVFSDAAGDRYLHGLRWLNRGPDEPEPVDGDELTRQCELAAAFAAEHHLPHVIVESNGIGKHVVGTLRRILAGSGCTAEGKDNHRPKTERILDGFDPLLAARQLHVHRSVYDTRFIEEMREWRPGRSGRDDGLDAVSGCLAANPHPLRRHIFRSGPPQPRWRPGAPQYQAIIAFKP